MARLSAEQKGELERYVLAHVEDSPAEIARMVAGQFGISRPTANRYLHALVQLGVLTFTGQTKARVYTPAVLRRSVFKFPIEGLEEDRVWSESVAPLLRGDPKNVTDTCAYGITEMVNNAIDHSESESVDVTVQVTSTKIFLIVEDQGVGIFDKIQRDHHLHDRRHAILELSKGKLTSDKSKHSGEGIFFTSRFFDRFLLESHDLAFIRTNRTAGDWLLTIEDTNDHVPGTRVMMNISRTSQRRMEDVYAQYSTPEGEGMDFGKTHVPLKLAMYEGESLISRSQAKRLLARVEKFREVMLDFTGVETIGQAFADEVFRVFRQEHPDVLVTRWGTTPEVERMIQRVDEGEEAAAALPFS